MRYAEPAQTPASCGTICGKASERDCSNLSALCRESGLNWRVGRLWRSWKRTIGLFSKRRQAWEQSREKARRLYLLPNSKYTLEQYLAEGRRIEEQIQRVDSQLTKVQQQIAGLREAIVDEEGIRRFCQQAAHNLDNMDDVKWRVLLERVRLKVVVPPGEQPIARIALPAVKEPVGEIALETSPNLSRQGRGNKVLPPLAGGVRGRGR